MTDISTHGRLGGRMMDVALKIWRFDAETGERELRDYQVEAPEWACLLDVLDIVKDQVDGTLSFRKSCRMMICGSCGMRMDGRAVLACKERMLPIVEAGHVPVISAMGNLPIVKDLVVDMGPFWQKMRAMKPWLQPGYLEAPEEKEFHVSPAETEVIHKEALCINCGCCVSECNSMESDPEFLGPAALAKGMRFVGDSRDQATVERLEDYNSEHGIWDCTRCYFCTERCPKGVDPRDAIAKLGAESIKARDRPRHGREARELVRALGEDDRLAARDRARAEDAGRRLVDQGDEVRDEPGPEGQGAAAVPAARRRERRSRRATSTTWSRSRAATAPPGSSRARRGSRTSSSPRTQEKKETRRATNEGRVLQGLPRLALGEGARHLDAGAGAEAGHSSSTSWSRSPAAAPATSTRPSPTTTCT